MKYFILIAAVLLITIRACVCSTEPTTDVPTAAVNAVAVQEPAAEMEPTIAPREPSRIENGSQENDGDLGIKAAEIIDALGKKQNGAYEFKSEHVGAIMTHYGKSKLAAGYVLIRSRAEYAYDVELVIGVDRSTGSERIFAAYETAMTLCDLFFDQSRTPSEAITDIISKGIEGAAPPFAWEEATISVARFPKQGVTTITFRSIPGIARQQDKRGPV